GIFRSYAVIAGSEIAEWGRVLMTVTAVMTIFIATTYMVKMKNIKRMFAYSSIEHSALVLIGLCFGEMGIYFAILHLLMHTLIKSGLFLHYNQLTLVYGSKFFEKMGGYLHLNPTGAIVLLIGIFSIVAVPPSGLFMSELGIFSAMVTAGYWPLVVLVALLLTVIVWAVCKNIIGMVFLPCKEETAGVKVSPAESLTQLILFLIAIYLGYFTPEFVNNLISDIITLI
ncbi:MAG: hypothetical protein HUJ90_07065, partial [Bacteroidales bacterium]|nr:hypothetical protein [Bacteroidales bacterium]